MAVSERVLPLVRRRLGSGAPLIAIVPLLPPPPLSPLRPPSADPPSIPLALAVTRCGGDGDGDGGGGGCCCCCC